MRLKNEEIVTFAEKLNENFSNKVKYIPMKIGFAIQKNTNILTRLVQEIDESKLEVGKEFGVLQQDGSYKIPKEKVQEVNKELMDLAKYEQEVDVKKILYSDIKDLEFTMPQIDSIMFMIEDDSE